MDPFPDRTGGRARGLRPGGAQSLPAALRARVGLDEFAMKPPTAALGELPSGHVKQLELASFAGNPHYLATLTDGSTRVVPVNGAPRGEVGTTAVIDLVKKVVPTNELASVGVMEQYDVYYLDRRRERPLPVVLVQLNDPEHSRYYIDPRTGRIAGNYSSRNWVSRWLYHGLHSLDFPWLYNYRPLWDIVVITCMVGGTALGVTSLILAWRVLGRTLRRRAAPVGLLNEDLV
jgi:hypothetical protein